MRSQRRLVIVLSVFAVLNATVWSLLVPPGQAPDELAHNQLASYIAHEHRYPEFGKTEGFGVQLLNVSPGNQAVVYTYSSYAAQPPLPYIVAAPFILIPTATTWMDYHQARVPQALAVGLFVLVMAALTRVMVPGLRHAPVAVGALAGLWPQITYLGAYFNADMLATVSSASIVFAWFWGARRQWDRTASIVTGVLLGLGVLAKLNVWVLVLLTAAVALATLRGPVTQRLRSVLMTAAAMLLVVLPWLAIAVSRYGTDVLANDRQQRLANKFDATPLDAASSNWSYVHMLFGGHWISNVSKTFVVGIPGDLPGAVEWMIPLAIMALGLVGGTAWLAMHPKSVSSVFTQASMRPHVFAVLLLPLLFGLASRNAFLHDIYFLGQGRYLFPALGPMLVYAVAGLVLVVPDGRWRTAACALLVVAAAAMNVIVLVRGVLVVYGNGFRAYLHSWQLGILILWAVGAIVATYLVARYFYSAMRLEDGAGTGASSSSPNALSA